MNLAVDFAFFNNKIQGTVNYFTKKTTNAFLDKKVSSINGLDTYVVNSGTIQNKGVEVALSFTPINNIGPDGKSRGFTWHIDPQLGQVINKLLSNGLNSHQSQVANANVYTSTTSGGNPPPSILMSFSLE